MAPRHPEPGKFDQDPRVAFDKTAGKYQYEDEETGQEFEWNEHVKTWLPLVSTDCGLQACATVKSSIPG